MLEVIFFNYRAGELSNSSKQFSSAKPTFGAGCSLADCNDLKKNI
jgi:hypothetical protein